MDFRLSVEKVARGFLVHVSDKDAPLGTKARVVPALNREDLEKVLHTETARQIDMIMAAVEDGDYKLREPEKKVVTLPLA